mgnify:CR=1 FL=1
MERIALSGVLHIEEQGFGFLHSSDTLPGEWRGIYVSASLIQRFRLNVGDRVAGWGRPLRAGEQNYGLRRIEAINGKAVAVKGN